MDGKRFSVCLLTLISEIVLRCPGSIRCPPNQAFTRSRAGNPDAVIELMPAEPSGFSSRFGLRDRDRARLQDRFDRVGPQWRNEVRPAFHHRRRGATATAMPAQPIVAFRDAAALGCDGGRGRRVGFRPCHA